MKQGIRLSREMSGAARGAMACALVLAAALGARATPAGERAAERKAEFDTTVALFASRSNDAAVQAIAAHNVHPAGTVAGEIESANKLVQVALYFRARYDVATAMQIANLVQARLQTAELAANLGEKAQIEQLRGFVSERLFHDLNAARASYARALASDPASRIAAAGVARMDALNGNRIGGGK